MFRYSFWKRTGVIKGTNLLVTHASLLLCGSADSHEMRWIKVAADSVTQELCKDDYSRGFEFIKWVYCVILKDHTSGFVAWSQTSQSLPTSRIFFSVIQKVLCLLTAENNRASQSFVLRMEISSSCARARNTARGKWSQEWQQAGIWLM